MSMTNNAAAGTPGPRKLLVGLVGRGIGHSMTPAMQEKEAREHGIALHYQLIDLAEPGAGEEDLAGLVQRALADGDEPQPGLQGCQCRVGGLGSRHSPWRRRCRQRMKLQTRPDRRILRGGCGGPTDRLSGRVSFARQLDGLPRGRDLQELTGAL